MNQRLLSEEAGLPSLRAHRDESLPSIARRLGLLLALSAVLFSGCATVSPPTSPAPARTRLAAGPLILPATVIGNHLVVEAVSDKAGPARFLIDTGSSVTLLSPEFVAKLGAKEARQRGRPVRVRSASGAYTTLPGVQLRRFSLGEARFEGLQALVLDCSDLSAHLGVTIDGVLGFPLFHDTILSLDYPKEKVVLTPADFPASLPGAVFSFSPANKVPLIPVQVGDRTVFVLVDSGSDGPLNLNPIGLDVQFISGPRPGATVATLAGDRTQQVGRLAAELKLGDYRVPQPVIDITDQLSSLGGDILKHFTLTFDQRRGVVTFYRDSTAPVVMPPVRGVGLGFSRTPAYWRVASVVPQSPAETAGILPGDLVTRINGEPVERWDLRRYETLMRTATWVEFTFLNGREETTGRINVFELIP